MAGRPIILVGLLLLGSNSPGVAVQSVRSANGLPKFMGREVTIIKPEREDDYFPKGPASVCIEGPPQRQCYTAPKEFGNNPTTVALVQFEKDTSALLFSAATGGVSGWGVHFALLRPGTSKNLQDFFFDDMSISNQGQHALWNEPEISATPIFVTAEYVQGPDESHYGKHRYMVSAYVLRSSSLVDNLYYWLEDRYLTVRKYDLDANDDILASEKQEILARLRRIKADARPQH